MTRVVGGVDYGVSLRNACVDQWKLTGYPVYSVNSASETASLRKQQVGIDILSNKSPEGMTKIASLIKIARKQKLDVAIIANADCYLFDISKLKSIVNQISSDSIFCLERLNINESTLRPSGKNCKGFDVFVIGSKALEYIDENANWKLGDTWWDYWFPITVLLGGGNLSALTAPILLHLDHPTRWDFESWKLNGAKFSREISRRDFSTLGIEFHNFFKHYVDAELSHKKLSALGAFTFAWLRKHADCTGLAESGTIEELKNRIVEQNFKGLAPVSQTLARSQAGSATQGNSFRSVLYKLYARR
jgi:hypothetical protein